MRRVFSEVNDEHDVAARGQVTLAVIAVAAFVVAPLPAPLAFGGVAILPAWAHILGVLVVGPFALIFPLVVAVPAIEVAALVLLLRKLCTAPDLIMWCGRLKANDRALLLLAWLSVALFIGSRQMYGVTGADNTRYGTVLDIVLDLQLRNTIFGG